MPAQLVTPTLLVMFELFMQTFSSYLSELLFTQISNAQFKALVFWRL